MIKSRFYERLLELPLFLGMSRGDLEDAVSTVRNKTQDYAKGKTVVCAGDVCDCIYLLVSGSLTATGTSDDNGYSITETMTAPDIMQPERIFGLTQRYTKTFRTTEKCSFICIGKSEVMQLSDRYEIFRINLLNIICTKSQRQTRYPWKNNPQTVRDKIVRFVEKRCMRPAGEKTVRIKMQRLAGEIGESRLNVSRELNAMQQEGLVTLRRGEIGIKALERLL